MRIARASRRNIVAMAELMTASPLLRRYGVAARSARTSLEQALQSRDTLLVALEREEVVGLAWVIVTRALDRAAYLRLLLVAERHQSGGAGAALLADAERRVRAMDCRHMVLLVTTTNRRARAFYVRQGYRHVGAVPGFVRPRISESLYVKSWRTDER